jgi:hypothetical protein
LGELGFADFVAANKAIDERGRAELQCATEDRRTKNNIITRLKIFPVFTREPFTNLLHFLLH